MDYIDVIKAVLEPESQLQWVSWSRKEAKNIQQKAKARNMDISQDHILREGDYATLDRQCLYENHLLGLCLQQL